ncbi:MAG: FAD-dependent oxidoreductase [Planctomycetota bacterium]
MTPRATDALVPGPIRGSIDEARDERHDLAIIGGGIYGIAALLEASRRGLRALLIERDDFGGGTSWSSHRIIHGGLRYLQSLDVVRFKESVRERRWFVETFPEHVQPLECLVPLPGKGTRRPTLFRCASIMNNTLKSFFGGTSDRLGGASVVGRDEFGRSVPEADTAGVLAAGRWEDGLMSSSERVKICMLRAACDLGGRAIAGTRVEAIESEGGRVSALRCTVPDGRDVVIRCDRVLNCAGPASGEVGAMLGGDHAPLFRPIRAFNVLLDIDAGFGSAVALTSRAADDRMLFIVPSDAGLAVGTWEERYDGERVVSRASVERLLSAARDVLKRDDLTIDRVSAVWSGLLPRDSGGKDAPSDRPVVVDHGRAGGLSGGVSISGVKYTTARLVAERGIALAGFGDRPAKPVGPIADPIDRSAWRACPPDPEWLADAVHTMRSDEAAATVDDVVRRRTTWYASPSAARGRAVEIGAAFGLGEDEAVEAVEASLGLATAMRG